jgi:hypothetical protein
MQLLIKANEPVRNEHFASLLKEWCTDWMILHLFIAIEKMNNGYGQQHRNRSHKQASSSCGSPRWSHFLCSVSLSRDWHLCDKMTPTEKKKQTHPLYYQVTTLLCVV